MENLDEENFKVYKLLKITNESWPIDNFNELMKKIYSSSDKELEDFKKLMSKEEYDEFHENSELIETKYPILYNLFVNYIQGTDYIWYIQDFRRIKKETGFINVPEQFHYLIDLVGMWAISDDILRSHMTEFMTDEDIKTIFYSLKDNLNELESWMVGRSHLSSTDDQFLFTCYYMIYSEVLSDLDYTSPRSL